MKKLQLIIGAIFLTLNIFSQTFNLTVNNGYGSGNFQAGDTINIFANPNPSNSVFGQWASSFPSLTVLPSLNEYHIRVVMPAQNVTLTPNYQTYSPWTFTHTQINGKELYYYFPAGMKGIIQCYHGAGGSATGWTDSVSAVENLNFCRYAVAHGYGLFITESNNRTTKQWVNNVIDSTNGDIVSIYKMIDTLVAHNILTGNEKMLAVSHSQGSGFNSIISYVKNFCAAALGGVAGKDTVFYFTNTPTYWQASRNDTSADPTRIPKIIAAYNVLSGRGIDAEYHILEPSPLFPKRFERIPGIDAAMAVGIFNDLNNAGYLDAQHYFNTNPRVNPNYINAVTSVPASFDAAIDDQVTVAFTEHKFYSDYNRLIIDFFDNHLCDSASTGIPPIVFDKIGPVFPNPFVTKIYFQNANGSENYVLTNSIGQIIWTGKNIDQQDFSFLQNGIYFLNVSTQTGQQTFKLIKQ